MGDKILILLKKVYTGKRKPPEGGCIYYLKTQST